MHQGSNILVLAVLPLVGRLNHQSSTLGVQLLIHCEFYVSDGISVIARRTEVVLTWLCRHWWAYPYGFWLYLCRMMQCLLISIDVLGLGCLVLECLLEGILLGLRGGSTLGVKIVDRRLTAHERSMFRHLILQSIKKIIKCLSKSSYLIQACTWVE